MKKVIKLIVILVIIAAAVVSYSVYKKHKNKPEWRLDSISIGDIREEVTASGTLNPSSQVEVGTEISGKIAKIYKDFNSTVKKGDLLAKLDTENLETALESAQSDVQRAQISVSDAKIDLDLQKELNKYNMSSSYDLQKAQNKYDQAVQSLANARFSQQRAEKNLQNAIITSPIDGVIVSRNVEEGQTVAASMSSPTLFIIANNLRKMQINADIDEADIGKIKIGLPVEFSVDAYADEEFEGKINQVRLSPTSTQNIVTYSVIIDVDNPQMKLLPGMTANVTIIVREKNSVLRVPETALRFKPSKELWKLFNLKWDNNLITPISRRGMSNTPAKTSGQPGQNISSSANPAGNREAIPDSLKAKIAQMTPEQRAAFLKKAKQRNKTNTDVKAQTGSNDQFNFSAGSLVQEKQSRGRVWILENGKPTPVDIVTGLSNGNFAVVISGLKEGQEFITGVNYKNAKQAASSSSAFTPGGFGARH